jgi:hypothetical protein
MKNINKLKKVASGLFILTVFVWTISYAFVYGQTVNNPTVGGVEISVPTHPMWYGYYHVNAQYGNFFNDVKNYTNTTIILQNSFLRVDLKEIEKYRDAFKLAIANNQYIILGLSNDYDNAWDDAFVNAKDYWNKVDLIYLADEPGWNKDETENKIRELKHKMYDLGLQNKSIAINYTNDQIIDGTGWQANNLDVVGFEAYVNASSQNNGNLIQKLTTQIQTAKEKIGSKPMFIVIQAYDRNGEWTNLDSLKDIQTVAYQKAFDDSNVLGLLLFSYARKGGTKDHQELLASHIAMGTKILGVSGSVAAPTNSDGYFSYDIPDASKILELMNGWKNGLAYNAEKDQYLVVGNPLKTKKIIGQLVSNDAKKVGNEFTISAAEDLVADPEIAYSSEAKKYLVTFHQLIGTPTSPTNPGHLYGRLVSDSGQALGSSFDISKSRIKTAKLAYDPVNKRFLVIYESASGNSIHLRTISETGSLGSDIVISPSMVMQHAPTIAVNSNGSEYCSVWAQENPDQENTIRILSKKVDAKTLTVGETQIVSDWGGPTRGFVGGAVLVEYNANIEKYLITWRARGGDGGRILARMTEDCGKPSTYPVYELLNDANGFQMAYNPYSKKIAIVSERTVAANNSSGNGDINILSVLDDRSRVIDTVTVFDKFGETGIKSPSIAANTTNGTFGVASSRDYGRVLFKSNIFYSDTSGPPPGLKCDPLPTDPTELEECLFWLSVEPPDPIEFPPGSDPESPTEVGMSGSYGLSLGYNSLDRTVLSVASDDPGGDAGVWGVLLDEITLQIKVPKFKIDQGPSDKFAGSPKSVYNPDSNKFLVAWEDERGGRTTRGRVINSDGSFATEDFSISGATQGFLREIIYNQILKKFVVLTESTDGKVGGMRLYLVENNGTVSSSIDVPTNIFGHWQGHSDIAFGSGLNEYLIAFIDCYEETVKGKKTEYCDYKARRIDGGSLQPLGEDMLVDNNARQVISVDYSPVDQTYVIAYESSDDIQGSGIYAKSLNSSFSLSGRFPVLTTVSLSYTDAYGAPVLHYNPWRDSFFVSSWDNAGGNIIVEFLSNGTVLNVRQPIAPPQAFNNSNNLFEKIIALFKPLTAQAAYGNFNQTSIVTQQGALVSASQGYESVVVSSVISVSPASSSTLLPQTPSASQPVSEQQSVTGIQISSTINNIYRISLGAAALLALLMMILGGYYYMTAAGNAERSGKGTDIIMSSLLGIVILFCAYVLLRTINPDLVNLKLKDFKDYTVPTEQQQP